MRSGGRSGGRGLEKCDREECRLARRESVYLVMLFLSWWKGQEKRPIVSKLMHLVQISPNFSKHYLMS